MNKIFILFCLVLMSGCAYTSVSTKDGTTLRRFSLLLDQKIGKVDLVKGTMDGYSSENAQIAGALMEAALRVKP